MGLEFLIYIPKMMLSFLRTCINSSTDWTSFGFILFGRDTTKMVSPYVRNERLFLVEGYHETSYIL
jgi:hypothetical protein